VAALTMERCRGMTFAAVVAKHLLVVAIAVDGLECRASFSAVLVPKNLFRCPRISGPPFSGAPLAPCP